jgi:rhombotail lipoprotein
MIMSRRFLAFTLLILTVSAACTDTRQISRRSNLMSFLYPSATEPPAMTGGPIRLNLPLRVGIAFVPREPSSRPFYAAEGLPAGETEERLLDIVKKSFEGRDWVKEIVIIPSTYLAPGGGFRNLDQLARMFDTSVIALVSIDQFQSSDPTPMSFLYLSIVGAYVLPLNHNDTRTLIDAAVFYVPARTFLLRAPGHSTITGYSTAIAVDQSLRGRSHKGLELAMVDLTGNLTSAIDQFKQRVIAGRSGDIDIVARDGRSVRASGSSDLWLVALLIGILFARRAAA